MSDFLINLPYHKRWWLPDNRHQLNSFMYGDTVHMSVIDSYDGTIKQSHYLKMTPGWEDTSALFQELANKRYPRNIMKRGSRMTRRQP